MACSRSALLLVVLALGCGGSTETSGTGGSGASAGSGATGASGGSGGTGASGASGGMGATPGGGGTSGTGAVGGTGGAPGIPPECHTTADCKLFTDCCSCQGYPATGTPPPSCLMDCKQSKCSELGVSDANLSCVAGRCVAGINCDQTTAFCNALPPSCAAGTVPSVVNGCWGSCVDATQCAGVGACTDCTGPLTTCVTIDMQGGDMAIAHHCVGIPKGCEGMPVCACMASNVCISPFDACSDLSGVPGMLCSCPNC